MKLFHAIIVALTLSLANCECDSKEREMLKSKTGITLIVSSYEKHIENINVNYTRQIQSFYRLMNFTRTDDIHFPFVINFQYTLNVYPHSMTLRNQICDRNLIPAFFLIMNSNEDFSLLLYGCNLQMDQASAIMILNRQAADDIDKFRAQFDKIASLLKPLCNCSEVSTYISECLRKKIRKANYQVLLAIVLGHMAALFIAYFLYNNLHKWKLQCRKRSNRVHVMPRVTFIN